MDNNDLGFGKPINNLKEHIKKLFQKGKGTCGENGFDDEFNFIEKKSEKDLYFGDYKSALKPANRIKNRYSNVLPLEKTRVVLNTIDGDEDSDYINASKISGGHDADSTYICTQGPLQNTIDDFWRMVWEQGSSVIVMLTKETENSRVKCAKYWPEQDFVICGKLRVTFLSADTSCEIISRNFRLEELQGETSRIITQFQYASWPDHGLPVSTSVFLELVRMVDMQKPSGPIIVHCSAGIGRSGTFCTVHTTIQKYRADLKRQCDENPVFNILQTVLFMRDQRPGMVQTREQYMFCYLSIAEETSQISKRLSRLGLSSSLNYST